VATLSAMTTLAFVPVATVVLAVLAIELLVFDILNTIENNYDYYMYGDDEAGTQVKINAAINVVTFGVTKIGGAIVSQVKNARNCGKYGENVISSIKNSGFTTSEVNAQISKFSKLGCTQSTIETLLKNPKCMFLGDDVLSFLGKQGGNQRLLAELVIGNGDDFTKALMKTGTLDDFCNLVWKYGSESAKVLTCGDDAISFVSKYENASDIIKCFKSGNVSGIANLEKSNVSKVYTFATDKTGKTFAAGSCNYDFNPTITVPEGYFDDIAQYTGSNYYYEKYNQLLEKDFISKMDVSTSVKKELYKLSDALDETRRLAKNSGRFNYGELYQLGYDEYSFMENWSVSNCGEVWSAREAILNGATFDELT
jgi:hypothetical protein